MFYNTIYISVCICIFAKPPARISRDVIADTRFSGGSIPRIDFTVSCMYVCMSVCGMYVGMHAFRSVYVCTCKHVHYKIVLASLVVLSGLNSSVGIATRYELDGPLIDSLWA